MYFMKLVIMQSKTEINSVVENAFFNHTKGPKLKFTNFHDLLFAFKKNLNYMNEVMN